MQVIVEDLGYMTEGVRQLVRDYLADHKTSISKLHLSFVSAVMRSNARMCIIPLQDYLGLDNKARVNDPAKVQENWEWRLKKNPCSKELAGQIFAITRRYGRLNWENVKSVIQ